MGYQLVTATIVTKVMLSDHPDRHARGGKILAIRRPPPRS